MSMSYMWQRNMITYETDKQHIQARYDFCDQWQGIKDYIGKA